MKICLITNVYEPYASGGAEIYVENIAEELALHNEVIVITSHPFNGVRSFLPSFVEKGNIKIYRFYPLNLYHLSSSKSRPVYLKPVWHLLDIFNFHAENTIFRIIKKERPDVVHTHNLNGFSLGIMKQIKKLRIPLVHTVHDFGLLCPYTNLVCVDSRSDGARSVICNYPKLPCIIYRKLKKNLSDNAADIIIFPSEATADIFHANKFFLDSRDTILPYCFELKDKAEKEKKINSFFDILFVGQLVKHKGVQVLIEAFRALPEEQARLHIVGSGDYTQWLKEMAAVDKRIKFYGKISHDHVRRFYEMADITVIPSIWPEVLGIVILESLSIGTPVIGSAIGGIPVIIKDGYNGFLFEPGNSAQLKQIIQNIMHDQGCLERLRFYAVESVTSFTVYEHTKKIVEVYQKAINFAVKK